MKNKAALAALVFLLVIGFFIKTHNLGYTSLSHDEVTMTQFTSGFLHTGVPYKMVGTYYKPLTTYELLPYSISLFTLPFGMNDYAARAHSLFWGMLEILFIYLLGATLFGELTGLAAAAIFIFHPWCLNWGQNICYPQLTQTLGTLTVLFFWKALDTSPMSAKYLYAAASFFSLTYLSWEGAGFLLPAMLVALPAQKGRDLSWIRNKHFWLSFLVVFLVVFIQESRRIFYQDPYLSISGGLIQLTVPQPVFLKPIYNPFYYVYNFLFTGNNAVLTVFAASGVFLVKKNRPLRYLLIILAAIILCLSNLIPAYSTRYIYFMEPCLIVSAVASGFCHIEKFGKYISRETPGARAAAWASGLLMMTILFVFSNDLFLKPFLLSKDPATPPALVRQNVYWNDYRDGERFVSMHAQKGDVVFVEMPHTLAYYTGLRSYGGVSTSMWDPVVFSRGGRFIDHYVGSRLLASYKEFRQIISGANRAWFIAIPEDSLSKDCDPETAHYIKRNFKVVYETYNGRIYFWGK